MVGRATVDVRADELNGYERFAECGFSERIIGVLIKAGINAPEQLLSMTPDRIRLIQGIGPTSMKEIEQYRANSNNEQTAST
jgi:DNA-directed RNA polymerase alpha subunit